MEATNEKVQENLQTNETKKWRWYHGVLIYAGIQAASFGLGAIVKSLSKRSEPRRRFHNQLL